MYRFIILNTACVSQHKLIRNVMNGCNCCHFNSLSSLHSKNRQKYHLDHCILFGLRETCMRLAELVFIVENKTLKNNKHTDFKLSLKLHFRNSLKSITKSIRSVLISSSPYDLIERKQVAINIILMVFFWFFTLFNRNYKHTQMYADVVKSATFIFAFQDQ